MDWHIRKLTSTHALTVSANTISWAHEICSEDNEERALVIGSMNEFSYVFQAWIPLLAWKQVEAPRYHKGYNTASIFSFFIIVVTLLIRYLQNRDDALK